MRADALAIWLLPRSPSEVVPSGTALVRVFRQHPGGRERTIATVRAPARVARLVSYLNSRQLGQPGAASCPAVALHTTFLGLRFLGRRDQALARAVEDGCGGLMFALRGHHEPWLEEGTPLGKVLGQLGIIK